VGGHSNKYPSCTKPRPLGVIYRHTMQIFRYDKRELIGTDLDPIEDILNLITTLKSKGYTSDLLREVHGFSGVGEINKTAKLISLHIDNAIGLSEQAFEGTPETSYLPLYYSTLNLSKVLLLLLGKRVDLERNRWHGAKYTESEMTRSFLNERIEIKGNGTIPLLYKTLTGKVIPRTGIKIPLQDIYSHITSVGAEYITVTKEKNKMFMHNASLIKDDTNGHYIKIEILGNSHVKNPPKPKTLKAFTRIKLIRPANNDPYYESIKIKGNFETVKEQLKKSICRSLISDDYYGGAYAEWVSYTPVNGKKHVFNEELSIMLAFFHLSNVVRYNPEHLYKLKDSRYWAVLLALRKHGYLKFIKLMWGNYNKVSFALH